jgi:hypothetical protein
MNQKGFANVILVVIIVVLAGALGYFTLVKKSPQATQQTPKLINWEGLIPEIKTALQQAFPERTFRDENVIISAKGDITGDDIPEVLVGIGCGATTCEFVLMRIENNKPTVASFKQKDGKVSYLVFTNGVGGAGRYESTVKLMEDKNAIYAAGYSAYNESSDSCGAQVYQWNRQANIFEFNDSLSNEVSKDYCAKICSEKMQDPNLKLNFRRICR